MGKIEMIISNLQKRKIPAKYFEKAEDAKKAILEEIKKEEVVGIGGSMTIHDMKLHEDLIKAGNPVHWHWLVEPSERNGVRQKAATADVYLTSTNALTEDGELINIDGVGNRVSGMFYGPKRVIVICGINKICSDIISGIDRIKNSACPPNAKRLGLKTPCAETGICNDCLSQDRMCNITTIINHKPMTVDLKVYIVGEELGY
ncbi:lactate utilization protein [Alkaliphilus peptidifermentans]|uniref:Uncharacterized ACR, YkgG family COG1556 n=1 Tax=Alkaliphilus peptidifermentans DSM 18978 TaxID=1120976 RepID=A0A1G5CFP7_9FIRM|nr:lactate utilization protein [Alkaliphilus peptidifermentans]SCY01299.1 Uncharacterised ACR, YkgG family COG1556 [Alkaliphilus peptidifermentans DSM 18978]